jgi:hypothetical protein
MDPPGELAELLQRLTELLRYLVNLRSPLGVSHAVELFLYPSDGERQGHQALLGSIVEVPLHASSLRVSRFDQPRPGGLHLFKLGADLGVQPFVVDGEASSRRCGSNEGRFVEQ